MEKIKTAAILAGGLSRRMGYDKKKLRIGGENIIKRIVNQLAIDFDDIIIVGCKPEDLLDIPGVRGIYPDEMEMSASLVGIYSGLRQSQSQYLYVTACDMPVYNHEYVVYMKDIIEKNPEIMGCVTRYQEWVEPFNAFYNIDLIPKIKASLGTGRKSIYKCFEKENIHYIDEEIGRIYSPGWEMFCNLNTPEELGDHINKSQKLS